MKNVLLSPHVGGFTEEALQANIDDSFNNLDLYLSGKPLENLVSLEDEY
jgi:phosphoglycerate dehydrogenase-like enzyme